MVCSSDAAASLRYKSRRKDRKISTLFRYKNDNKGVSESEKLQIEKDRFTTSKTANIMVLRNLPPQNPFRRREPGDCGEIPPRGDTRTVARPVEHVLNVLSPTCGQLAADILNPLAVNHVGIGLPAHLLDCLLKIARVRTDKVAQLAGAQIRILPHIRVVHKRLQPFFNQVYGLPPRMAA